MNSLYKSLEQQSQRGTEEKEKREREKEEPTTTSTDKGEREVETWVTVNLLHAAHKKLQSDGRRPKVRTSNRRESESEGEGNANVKQSTSA